MSEERILQKLDMVEAHLRSVEKKRKDAWDIFNIIASLLIPASIAFSGYYFSKSMKEAQIANSQALKDAEISSAEKLAAREENIALINAKVEQARLVVSFIEPLTGDDENKKKIAIKGLLIALPERGPDIVSTVSVADTSEEVKKFAKTSLDERRNSLVQRMFSSDKPTRITATTELVRGWGQDVALIPLMVKYATKHISHKSGVINALVVLENIDKVLLTESRGLIEPFLLKAAPNGPQTKAHVDKVAARLN